MLDDDPNENNPLDPKPPSQQIPRTGLVGKYKVMLGVLSFQLLLSLPMLYAGIACGLVPLCGQEFSAKVTNLHVSEPNSRRRQCWAEYDYRNGTQILHHSNRVSVELYNSLDVGEELKVRWLSWVPAYNNPIVVINGKSEDEIPGLIMFAISIVWNTFILTIIGLSLRANKPRSHLYVSKFGPLPDR